MERTEERTKKYTITTVFGVIGIASWLLTLLLRERAWNGMGIMQFLLGVMPNISACWLLLWFGENRVMKKGKMFTFKVATTLSVVIFLLAVVSEMVHDVFLDSPFDKNDIIATILAIVVYLACMYVCMYVCMCLHVCKNNRREYVLEIS